MCGAGFKARIRKAGFDVDEVRELFYETAKSILAGKPEGMAITLHMCQGNLRSRKFYDARFVMWRGRGCRRIKSLNIDLRRIAMGKEYWEDKHYAYFCNKECEYFPCHPTNDPDSFNCLFCYCPLYVLGDRCGGNFVYLPNGCKDCSRCMFPHRRENYGKITERYGEILAAIPYPDLENDQ